MRYPACMTDQNNNSAKSSAGVIPVAIIFCVLGFGGGYLASDVITASTTPSVEIPEGTPNIELSWDDRQDPTEADDLADQANEALEDAADAADSAIEDAEEAAGNAGIPTPPSGN